MLKRSYRLVTLWFLLLTPFIYFSQDTSIITVRKPDEQFFFYQAGEESDRISKNSHDVFVLICGDKLKKDLVFLTENARLLLSEKDSLVRLQYLPGLKYEAWYAKEDQGSGFANESIWVFQSYLNGTSNLDRKSVRIRVLNKKKDELWIENVFLFTD
ncbi:MAG TPA: hypothetical protein PLQ93_02425 [Bacteroidia bacterium]|nr:hypothetical protein [Bacteroidia bacterium]